MSSTPTTSSTADELRDKVYDFLTGYGVRDPAVKERMGLGDYSLNQALTGIMALIVQDREARERKTLETVAAMTGGGSSAQEALDTIKFYAHNKLFAINNPIPDSKAKA